MSPTLVKLQYTRVCVCLFVRLLGPTDHLPKRTHSNISRRQNVHVHPRGRAKGYCHTTASEGREAHMPTYVRFIVTYFNELRSRLLTDGMPDGG